MIHEVFSSRRRIEILLNLSISPASFSELQRRTGLNHTSLSIHLKKLLSCRLVEKDGNSYRLSHIGEIVYGTLENLDGFIAVFEKDPNFWAEHDLSCLPEELVLRIGDLGCYEIVSCRRENPLCFIEKLDKILHGSRWIKVVSSIMLPVCHFLSEEKDTSIVVSRELAEVLERECVGFPAKSLYVASGIRLMCMTTDRGIVLGLYLLNGEFDMSKVIISTEAEAIKWGEDVFEYFASRSLIERIKDKNSEIHLKPT
jgi:predicted transcriptional regulator